MAISNRTATTANSGSAAASSLTLNKPTGTSAGDLLIIEISANGGTGCTITTLSGWTLFVRTNNTTNLAQAIYYRVADGTEGATFVWSLTSEFVSGVCNAYTGVDNKNPFAGSTTLAKTTASTSATFGAVTQVAQTVYAVLCVSGRNTTAATTITASSGYTVDGDTCTTATTFIISALQDQHTTFGLPIVAVTPGSATFSTTSSDIDTVIMLRPDISVATAITIDTIVSNANIASAASGTAFTTGYAELLVVYMTTPNVDTVSGITDTAGNTWHKGIGFTDTLNGADEEIWWAYSSSAVIADQVKVTMTSGNNIGVTVITYKNTATTSAIGATNSAAADPGTPSANVTTTRANSLVTGVILSVSGSASTVGTGQSIIQSIAPQAGSTKMWGQIQNAVTPSSGTSVTINDTTSILYGMAIAEILAPITSVTNSNFLAFM